MSCWTLGKFWFTFSLLGLVYFFLTITNADANAWYKKKDAKQYSKVQKKQKQNIRDTFKKNEDNLQTGQGTAANFQTEII